MKIYKYYIIPEEDSADRKYELYAFTSIKDYAERFELERDMKRFLKGDVTDIDKEDYMEFANNNRGNLLDEFSYESTGVKEDNSIVVDTVYVLSTYNEYQECKGDSAGDYILAPDLFENAPYIKVFSKSIIKSLKVLEYSSLYKLLSTKPKLYDDNDDFYDAPMITIDEFNIFLNLYGKLFK